MVATNYKMKERTRRPPREREQEERREEEVEQEDHHHPQHLGHHYHQQCQEVDSSVTMEGRVINARLPRGVVEV